MEHTSNQADESESLFDRYLGQLETDHCPSFEDWVRRYPERDSDLRTAHAEWLRACNALDRTRPLASRADGPVVGLRPGVSVGDFRLVQHLGRGGQGTVWEAHQISLDRRVALKLVPAERVDAANLARFHQEARAGGRLAHPGIVAVHAWGETDGVHWIAQELVAGGRTLRDWIDEARHAPELSADYHTRTARLVAALCDALAAAHAAGVLHRDIKPLNVLLTADDRPKLTDFGLARLSGEPGLSLSGDVLGTYAYMSPEQASGHRTAIDERTDVFSTGVLLYELLALQRPFEGDTTQQIVSKILFDEPVPLHRLRSRIPQDLSVLCGKALEKSPDRRYPTIRAFGDDLRLFLAHRPIKALPPGLVDRARKWVRRNPIQTVAASIILVALAAMSILLNQTVRANQRSRANLEAARDEQRQAEQARRAEEKARIAMESALEAAVAAEALALEEKSKAQEERVIADRVAGLMESLFQAAHPEVALGAETTVVEMLDRGRTVVDGMDDSDLEVKQRLMAVLARSFFGLGVYSASLAIWRDFEAMEASTELDVSLATLNQIALCQEQMGQHREAEAGYRCCVELGAEGWGPDNPTVITFQNNLAAALESLGRYDEAAAIYLDVLERRRRILGEEHRETLMSLSNLGILEAARGNSDRAATLLEECLVIRSRVLPMGSPDAINTKNSLGMALKNSGDLDRAVPLLEEGAAESARVQGPSHQETAKCSINLADAYLRSGRIGEASIVLGSVDVSTPGLAPRWAAEVSGLQGDIHMLRGENVAAEGSWREAYTRTLGALGPEHHVTVRHSVALARALVNVGKYEEALGLMNPIVVLAGDGNDSSTRVVFWTSFEAAFLGLGRSAAATDAISRLRLEVEAYPAQRSAVVFTSLRSAAEALLRAGHIDGAIELLGEVWRRAEGGVGLPALESELAWCRGFEARAIDASLRAGDR